MLSVQASALFRLVPCKGQIALTPHGVGADTNTIAAREGTAMHQVSTDVLNKRISHPLDYLDRQMSNGVYITAAMAEVIAGYTDTLLARGFTGQTEINLDWLCETPNGPVNILSRCDHAAWDAATSTLYIDDAKFGWRIVEPFENWTLLAYAIGYVQRHQITPLKVVMTIHQPRPRHEDGKSRSWELDSVQLYQYQERLRGHMAQLYLENPLVTGWHCDHCPMLTVCPAATNAGYNSVDVATDAFNDNITNEEFMSLLDTFERAHDHLSSLITAYKELGMHRVQQGQVLQNKNGHAWMVEYGEGNRRFKEGMTPELIQALTGVSVSVTKTVTPAEGVRRGISEAVMATLTERPSTGAKLVRKDVNKTVAKILNR